MRRPPPSSILRLFLLTAFCLTHFLQTGAAEIDHEAYIWQRQWSPRLKASVRDQVNQVDGLTVLVAEIDTKTNSRYLPNVDYALLKSTGLPITLALRVNLTTYSQSEFESARADGFISWIQTAIMEARQKGLNPVAVEIDLDCPTSKLEFYTAALIELRKDLDGVPLSITTLPTWMQRPDAFQELVHAVDHFVLQVHSIQRPESIDDKVALCDPHDARRWIRQAGQFNKPFHVALPTYAYHLSYDSKGRLVKVAGENASPLQHPDWKYRVVRADPKAMSGLVRELDQSRPAACEGIIWYRLPIGDELNNWDPLTWRAVKSGRNPAAQWQVRALPPKDGVTEIEIFHESEIALAPPRQISARLDNASAVAWDGQRNYAVKPLGDSGLVWQWPDRMTVPLLPHGTRWTIGWVRLDPGGQLNLSLTEDLD